MQCPSSVADVDVGVFFLEDRLGHSIEGIAVHPPSFQSKRAPCC